MKIFLALTLFLSSVAWSQEEPGIDNDENLSEIEQELGKSGNIKNAKQPNAKEKQVNEFADLVNLAPFSNVAVIQKRFLPKTERFELNANASLATNNQFFNSMGAFARVSYYFNEKWAVELNYLTLTTSERDVIKDLKKEFAVETKNFSTPKSFTGIDIKYVPMYGKMSLLNKKIISYDLYFSLGGGSTLTTTNENASTVHIGAGELFALSKSTAFRWDFSWNFYSAKGIDQKNTQNFNNLFISLGFSFLFPEAKYR